MKTHVLFASALLIAAAGPAALGTPAAAQTLEECLALARDHAPRLRVADAGVSRAEQAIREARAALSPTLRLGAGFTQFSEAQRVAFPIPGAGGTQAIKTGSASALDVRTGRGLPLTSGGRGRALVHAAEAAHAGLLAAAELAES